MWQFVGSNDQNCGKFGNWFVLCEDLSKSGYRNEYFTKYCDVDEKVMTKFRCLGISVLNTLDGERAWIKDMRMWRRDYL